MATVVVANTAANPVQVQLATAISGQNATPLNIVPTGTYNSPHVESLAYNFVYTNVTGLFQLFQHDRPACPGGFRRYVNLEIIASCDNSSNNSGFSLHVWPTTKDVSQLGANFVTFVPAAGAAVVSDVTFNSGSNNQYLGTPLVFQAYTSYASDPTTAYVVGSSRSILDSTGEDHTLFYMRTSDRKSVV